MQRADPSSPVNTRTGPEATLQAILEVLGRQFPHQSPDFLASLFVKICDLFAGRYPGYQACDTLFHDLDHTCQASLATARILDGHIRRGGSPRLCARDYELGIAGIWLHDIGFLKATGDNEGTGAKYTLVHVQRSADFAGWFLPRFGVTADEVLTVQKSISCTGANVNTTAIAFRNETERLIGYALGTGDILGQMAAADYPEKLPKLFLEFQEAAQSSADTHKLPYASARDLLARTRGFYNTIVRPMLAEQWGSVHECLPAHFGDGRNHYFEAIERNLERIDRTLSAA